MYLLLADPLIVLLLLCIEMPTKSDEDDRCSHGFFDRVRCSYDPGGSRTPRSPHAPRCLAFSRSLASPFPWMAHDLAAFHSANAFRLTLSCREAWIHHLHDRHNDARAAHGVARPRRTGALPFVRDAP